MLAEIGVGDRALLPLRVFWLVFSLGMDLDPRDRLRSPHPDRPTDLALHDRDLVFGSARDRPTLGPRFGQIRDQVCVQHPIYLGWNDEEDQLQEQRTRIRLRSSKRTVRPESLTSVQNFIEAKIHNDGEEL